jgi:protease-4
MIGLFLGALLLYWLFSTPEITIAPGSLLVFDLSGEYVEAAEAPLLSRLVAEPRRPFVSLLLELEKAGRDDRLDAVVLRIRDLQIGWSKAQELRDAITRLTEQGRRVVAYLEIESFGANLEYYVACAADEVYVSAATRAPLVGLAAEYLFLGGLWDHFGIEIEVERIGRYKSAADRLTGRSMSDAHREMANALLDSLDAQFVEGIASSRGLTPGEVRVAIDAAPVDPGEMLAKHLIDGELYLEDLLEQLGDGPLVRSADYASVSPESVGYVYEERFALIYGTGGVVMGGGDISSVGNPTLASDTVSKAIEDAANDDSIAAIIFRIDSPGGSPLASDIVWRAGERAKLSGKPFIASFSDVAASGGYYVAAGADAIIASPASITGSIGVFVLRPVLAGLFDKLDIGFDSLTRGAHAEFQLSTRPLSESSRERLRSEIASIYHLFVERVAEGRPLDWDGVDAVARGRVWTGAQAAERGLVDELGGLDTAVRRAKTQLGMAPDADVALVVYPPPKGLPGQIEELLRGVQLHLGAATPQAELVRRLEPWLQSVISNGPSALIPFAFDVH